MPAVATFGLSAAAIARRTYGLVLDTDSTPTLADAEEMFEEHAGDVAGFLRARKVDPGELTSDGALSEGYQIARKLLMHSFTAALAIALMPNEDGIRIAEFHESAADTQRKRFRTYVAELGNARPTGHEAPATMGSAYERKRRQRAIAEKSPTDRLGRMLRQSGPRRP